VDCVNFILNAAETVPQQEVLDSLRLFAKEVMPRFARANAARSSTAQAATAAGAR